MRTVDREAECWQLAEKVGRALRDGTGCTFTREQVAAMMRSPFCMHLVEMEREELLAEAERRQQARLNKREAG
jgi:hypothetical protein